MCLLKIHSLIIIKSSSMCGLSGRLDNTVIVYFLLGASFACRLHSSPSPVATHLCFWEPPRTWAQGGPPPASQTEAAVDLGIRKQAVQGQGKDLRGPSVLQGSWGTRRSAAPCSRGIPVEGSPGGGSPVEVGPGLGSPGRWGHCLGTEEAARNSSWRQTLA